MEKLTTKQVHYTTDDASWPTATKTASEIAEILNIPEERVRELADGHFMPHWRIDGGEPIFQTREVKQWAAKNILQRVDGTTYPIHLRLMIDPPPAQDAPAQIREIDNLREVPIAQYPPGVYFLVQNNEVVYVGQSVNPVSRIVSHKKDKHFDRAYMIPVPSSDLDAVEGAIIRALNPRLNSGQAKIAIGPGRKEDDGFSISTYAPQLAKPA